MEKHEIRDLEQQSPEPRETGQKTAASVMLTNERPVASSPLARKILADAPPVLEVSVTKVINPAETPVAIFVYLTTAGKKKQPEPEKVLIGNFTLYPPDRPGNFLLRASTAFSDLRVKDWSSNSTEIRLMLELRRVSETRPWTPLQITISVPKWRQE